MENLKRRAAQRRWWHWEICTEANPKFARFGELKILAGKGRQERKSKDSDLGGVYKNGIGVAKDADMAPSFFERAASLVSLDAVKRIRDVHYTTATLQRSMSSMRKPKKSAVLCMLGKCTRKVRESK